MRIEGGSPNLINGVSRQPPEVRLTSQLEESVNQFPTITRGLVPRNPTILMGRVDSALPASSLVHLIDRDAAERYAAAISASGVLVSGLDGTARTVTAPGGYGYLSGATKDDILALTVQDHTFVLNKKKVVQKGSATTPVLATEALVHVVQGDYFSSYKIIINGSVAAWVETEGGPYDDSANARAAEYGANTKTIASLLATGMAPIRSATPSSSITSSSSAVSLNTSTVSRVVSGGFVTLSRVDGNPIRIVETGGITYGPRASISLPSSAWSVSSTGPGGAYTLTRTAGGSFVFDTFDVNSIPSTAVAYLASTLSPATWQVSLMDNVIHIKNLAGADFSIEVEAGTESRIRAHKGLTSSFTELPRRAPDGFRIKVSGSEDTDYDDYWVKFSRGTNDGQGRWEETVAPGAQYQLDPATMPHILVRNPDGTFTFKPGTWADRKVGDDETNPWPSFVGYTISEISFGNGRLGLASGESIANSRSGDFFDFWVESILTSLDTDPVDAAISYPAVSTINHVVPFAGEDILFTASVPFRLGKGEVLTQKTVHYPALSGDRVSPKCRPVVVGPRLFFVSDGDSGSTVHEMTYDSDVANIVPQSITDHVTGYIPTGVSMMAAAADLKMLFLSPAGEPASLYVYKWLWIGSEKAQSAWQKWTFDAPVVAMKFIGEDLVMVQDRGTSWEILRVSCNEAWTRGKLCAFLLDRQVITSSGVYDAGNNRTVFSLPYPDNDVVAYSWEDASFGSPLVSTGQPGNVVYVEGNWQGKMVAFGFPFSSYGVLSPLLHRAKNNQGGYGNAVPGFVTTVASVKFGTGPTHSLALNVERNYRPAISYLLVGDQAAIGSSALGAVALGRIKEAASIMAKSEDFRIQVSNPGVFPYALLSISWSGDARPVTF